MSSAQHDRRIGYIEFSVTSVPEAKRFYGEAFGWSFEDYGPEYASFADGRLNGGFQTVSRVATGGPLVGSTRSIWSRRSAGSNRRAAPSCEPFSVFPVAAVSILPTPAATSWRYGPTRRKRER